MNHYSNYGSTGAYSSLWAILLVLVLSGFGGCQAPATPQNVEQSVAYAYPVHAVATGSVTELLKSGKITVEAAESALQISRQVKVSLDLAQSFARAGKPTDAAAALKLALGALEGLQKFVEESRK